MFTDPRQNVSRFGLAEGAVVVDFGSGSGTYALELARRVGRHGRVYAVDVQRELLERLEKEAEEVKLRNIHIVWGNVERLGGVKLADGLADFVLFSNILFQLTGRYTAALEAKRLLKPGGRTAVIDWRESFGNLGPPPDRVVTPEAAKEIFKEAEFIFERDFPSGEHHYGLIFKKS